MKKLFVMAIAAVMSLGASAQLISSNTVTHKKGNGYNRLSVSYTSLSNIDEDAMSGISAAWTKGIAISKTTPLFIETGLGLNYAWKSEDEYNINWLTATVPVNLVYKYEITDGIKLAPFAGLYLRGNLVGNISSDYFDEDINFFDDYEDDGFEASRFSFGWNIGVGVDINKFYLGISYGSDFNEFVEDADKIGTFSATVGFNF
ncbi:MAG: porin family protein [Prevotella sp.]|nr:porin family protein [Prevotella sp.]